MSFIEASCGPFTLLIDFISEMRLGIWGRQVEQDEPNINEVATDGLEAAEEHGTADEFAAQLLRKQGVDEAVPDGALDLEPLAILEADAGFDPIADALLADEAFAAEGAALVL